ncbi:MAG TPA: hypothetical protein VFA78_00175 [Chloroflexota bacterium]|nr:hypothetical protein [Chloroflexota bacterium]
MGKGTVSGTRPAAAILESALPWLQQDFREHGPLRRVLPDEFRIDIVRVFTEILARADDDDGNEAVEFVEEIVRTSATLGAKPHHFELWLERYEAQGRNLVGDSKWEPFDPIFARVRVRLAELKDQPL